MFEIIALILGIVWFIIIYNMQKKSKKLSLKYCIIAMLAGAIPVMLLTLIAQIGLGFGLRLLPDGYLKETLDAFIVAALVEESLKMIAGIIICKKVKPERHIDCVLIFACVGLGFMMTEHIMGTSGIVSTIVQTLAPGHLSFQIIMGDLYYRNKKGAALIVPVIIHGIWDTMCLVGPLLIASMASDAEILLGAALLLLLLPFCIGITIFTLVKYGKIAKAEDKLVTETSC